MSVPDPESPELVYLDNAATTPLDPRVWAEMEPWFTGRFGNASSRQHAIGRRAAEAVEQARERVAAWIGAEAREITFTSGATESNNLALFGVAGARAYEPLSKHVLTSALEHHAILDPLERLEEAHGFEVTRLCVDGEGRLDLDVLERALARGPRLVTLMHVNNELGSVHPIAAIGALCRARGVLFHTDAAQSAGKLPLDVNAAAVDLLSLSGHKVYGPQGVGALYLRRRRPRVRCQPSMYGGGHEKGLRSGTLNVAGIVGLGAAAELCRENGAQDAQRIAALRDALEADLQQRLAGVRVHASGDERVCGISNVSIEGVDSESLLSRLAQVAASTSAACTSATRQPSHVLRALGLAEAEVASSVRFSLGRFTTEGEVRSAAEKIEAAVRAERSEGPRAACEL